VACQQFDRHQVFRICGPGTKSVYLFCCSLEDKVLSATGVTFVLAVVDFLYCVRFISYVYVGDNIEVRSARGGIHRFSNMGAISKFQEPGGWCEANSILKTHKYWASPCKIFARRPGICTPLNERL
jgi:hypothetical protein